MTNQKPAQANIPTRKPLEHTRSQRFSIGIVYVASTPSRCEEGVKFTAQVDSRLRVPGQKLSSHKEELSKIIEFDEDFYSLGALIATISDTKPLLLADSRGEDSVHAFRTRKPNTILAIIDSDGRNKTEVQNIRAELHKFGNRKIGALTYCTTRQSLEKLFGEHKAIPEYFPIGVLWKLNSMHGGQNFSIKPLSDTPLMIVGAHISHPGPEAAQHCPSVASIVSNVNPDSTTYPGCMRLQPTLRSVETKEGRLVQHVEFKILELEDMIVERCSAWKKNPNNPTPQVIFYRDGLNIVQNNVISTDTQTIAIQEMRAILAAIRKVFPNDEPSLTYILANKRYTSPYGSEREIVLDGSGIGIFSPNDKHTYYVMPSIENETRTSVKLLQLVSHPI